MSDDHLVLGESVHDLAAEMLTLDFDLSGGDMATISGNVAVDGPLLRAMARAEAELLLEDAAAMSRGAHQRRTPEARQYAAWVLVVERLTAAVREWLAGQERAPRAGEANAQRT